MENSARLSDEEKRLLSEINYELELLAFYKERASFKERAFYERAVDNFIERINILDKQISGFIGKELLQRLELLKKERAEEKEIPSKKILLREKRRIIMEFGNLKVNKQDKIKLMIDLKLTNEELKKLRRTLELSQKEKRKIPMSAYFRKPNPFVSLSSKIFFNISLSLSEKDFFKGLHSTIRKAALPFLLNSYLSLMLFSTSVAFIAGILGAIIITILSSSQNLVMDIARNIIISFLVPILIFFLFYIYPYSQISTFRTKIENELPFFIMHISTIAGSGVEPTRIFRIIALSKDYPAIGKEARKLMNQINFYGYDLVNALRATSKTTSSTKLADVFNGIATIISTGGNLQSYLNNSAKNSLLDYKLKRQKYIEASSTYADIYTGLLITAPLLFMLLLSLIKVIGFGLDVVTLGVVGIGSIVVLNLGFLVFLHISQPEG